MFVRSFLCKFFFPSSSTLQAHDWSLSDPVDGVEKKIPIRTPRNKHGTFVHLPTSKPLSRTARCLVLSALSVVNVGSDARSVAQPVVCVAHRCERLRSPYVREVLCTGLRVIRRCSPGPRLLRRYARFHGDATRAVDCCGPLETRVAEREKETENGPAFWRSARPLARKCARSTMRWLLVPESSPAHASTERRNLQSLFEAPAALLT